VTKKKKKKKGKEKRKGKEIVENERMKVHWISHNWTSY
jgi:hypothetical protein